MPRKLSEGRRSFGPVVPIRPLRSSSVPGCIRLDTNIQRRPQLESEIASCQKPHGNSLRDFSQVVGGFVLTSKPEVAYRSGGPSLYGSVRDSDRKIVCCVIHIAIHNSDAYAVLLMTCRAVRALLCRRKYLQPADCHGRGREFESRRPRHSFQGVTGRDTGNSNPQLNPQIHGTVLVIPAAVRNSPCAARASSLSSWCTDRASSGFCCDAGFVERFSVRLSLCSPASFISCDTDCEVRSVLSQKKSSANLPRSG